MKVVYKNVSIDLSEHDLTEKQVETILQRAANKEKKHCLPGELTLSDAVRYREEGENYQFCDTVATRAFENELHKARKAGEIPFPA